VPLYHWPVYYSNSVYSKICIEHQVVKNAVPNASQDGL
jgi:hypothetical protein